MDYEQKLGVLLPKGKNIKPVITQLLKDRGIDTGEGRRNGTLHGDFENFRGRWTEADIGNVIPEVDSGTYFQVGFSADDYELEYMASLGGRSEKVTQLMRFDSLFDQRTHLSVVVRDNEVDNNIFTTPKAFRNRRFLGRYPSLEREYFKQYFPGEQVVPVRIDTTITGGEEGFVISGAADGAMVIVQTGTTLKKDLERPLREMAVVAEHIQPVLVANEQAIRELGLMPQYEELLDRLQSGKKGSRRWGVISDVVSSAVLPQAIA